MAVNNEKPIAFVKFIIVATLALTFARMIMFGTSPFSGSSTAPYAFVLWIFYRFARLQPWWPFANGTPQIAKAGGTNDYQQVQIPDVFRAKASRAKPLKPGYKAPKSGVLGKVAVKRIAQEVAGPGGRTITERYAPTARSTGLTTAATDQLNYNLDNLNYNTEHMTAKEFAFSKLSNVGIRSRVVRNKTQRSKTIRAKTARVKRHELAILK